MSQPCLNVCVLLNCFQNYVEMKSLPELCPETIFLWMNETFMYRAGVAGRRLGWMAATGLCRTLNPEFSSCPWLSSGNRSERLRYHVINFNEISYVSDNCWLFLYYNRSRSFPYYHQVLPVPEHNHKIFTWMDSVLRENKWNTLSANTSLICSVSTFFATCWVS